MTAEDIAKQIEAFLNEILQQKGLEPVSLSSSTAFLGGDLPIDSLDLAVLVTQLQDWTHCDPFASGFKRFRTAGELAQLYADCGSAS